MMKIRNYSPADYEEIKTLYLQSDLYGGQFDEARDSEEKLNSVTKDDPESILVCEEDGKIIGTISLIENGRVAWLFRFAVLQCLKEEKATELLYHAASDILKSRGYDEILVYSPQDDTRLTQRYLSLGMNKGSVYTCFWKSTEL